MPRNSNKFSKIKLIVDGVQVVVPCLDFCLYWTGKLDTLGGELEAAYLQMLEGIGVDLKFFQTDTMAEGKQLRKTDLERPLKLLRGKSPTQLINIFFAHDADHPDGGGEHSILFHYDEDLSTGCLRLTRPIDVVDNAVAFFQNLVDREPFVFGTAGYSLSFNFWGEFETSIDEHVYMLSRRYPGIDLPAVGATLYAVEKGIKCANWLSYINNNLVERLGSHKQLMAKATAKTLVHEAAHGVTVQAGPLPCLGDVNRREELKEYKQAGNMLAPVRAAKHPPFIFSPIEMDYDEAITSQWLARFD